MLKEQLEQAERTSDGNDALTLLEDALRTYSELLVEDLDASERARIKALAVSYLRRVLLLLPGKQRTGVDEVGRFVLFLVVEAPEELRDELMFSPHMAEAKDALLSIHGAHREAFVRASLGRL